jgi:hypothetical protein
MRSGNGPTRLVVYCNQVRLRSLLDAGNYNDLSAHGGSIYQSLKIRERLIVGDIFVPGSRSFPMPYSRRTEIGLNAVFAAAVVVLLMYVLIGPPAA